MGYRSDVSIAIYAPEPEMTAFVASQRLKHEAWFNWKHQINKYTKSCVDDKDNRYDETWLVLHAEFEGTKWYGSYDDVASWLRCIQEAQRLDLNTEFVRVGEEDEDIETDYYGDWCDYHLGVHRTIYQDFPKFIEE
jgi:hypothetical protein